MEPFKNDPNLRPNFLSLILIRPQSNYVICNFVYLTLFNLLYWRGCKTKTNILLLYCINPTSNCS